MVRRFGFYVGAALLTSVALPVSPSFAGFEFVAPLDAQETSQRAPQQSQNNTPILEQSEIDTLLPVMSASKPIIEEEPLDVLPMGMKATVPAAMPPVSAIEKDMPPTPAAMPAPKMAASAPAPVASTVKNATVIEGFASQIPLVIALQQVIPAQYQYAFADGVNPGVKVDWQGGKPWDQVVSDMIARQNMVAEVSGKIVYIRRQDMTTTMVAPTSMPTPIHSKAIAVAEAKPKKIPLLPTPNAMPRTPKTVENSLLFDSPQNADLSGVRSPISQGASVVSAPAPVHAAASQPKSTDRLELGDLSIGQPMQLFPSQKKTVKTEPADTVVKNKKILVADPIELKSMPVYPPMTKVKPTPPVVEKTPLASSSASLPASPVLNKSILIDTPQADTSAPSMVQPAMPLSLSAPVALEKTDTAEKPLPMPVLPEMNGDDIIMSPETKMSMMEMTPAPEIIASASPVAEMGSWEASSGETLRAVLEEWTTQAGASLIWESNYDYPLQADIVLSGSFETAVRTLLDGLSNANPRPLGRLHRNAPSGQPVLVIETDTLTN